MSSSAQILDGKAVSKKLLDELQPKIKELDPKLVIIQIGDDSRSGAYITHKKKACEKVGMRCEHKHLGMETNFEQLLSILEDLNSDEDVTGIIVQLPLPEHLAPATPLIHRAIHPKKDVDGFTAHNLGKILLSTAFEDLPPATPAGVITLLEAYDIPIAGKHSVIVGRSNIVGKPLGMMLLNRDATVTLTHSKTPDLKRFTLQADILISAVGKPKLVTKDMVKKGAVVVDVGISQENEKLCGDVDFDNVKSVASWITPVPGGVGPMTIASLIRNVVQAAEKQKNS